MENIKKYKKPNITGEKNPAKRPEVREKIRIAKLKYNPGAFKVGERKSVKTEFKKGHVGYWHGKNLLPEHKGKIARFGVANSNWFGGKSFEPYTTDWTKTLKISIRERDKYTCKLCGKKQSDVAFCVHHIDYNKMNCDPVNLITLCQNCHAKTNTRRNYWKEFFYAKNIY